jgi:hypothetical protein
MSKLSHQFLVAVTLVLAAKYAMLTESLRGKHSGGRPMFLNYGDWRANVSTHSQARDGREGCYRHRSTSLNPIHATTLLLLMIGMVRVPINVVGTTSTFVNMWGRIEKPIRRRHRVKEDKTLCIRWLYTPGWG